MNLRLLATGCLLFFFPLLTIHAGARQESNNPLPGDISAPAYTVSAETPSAEEERVWDQAEIHATPSRAETVLRAIEAAYPDRIRTVEFYDGDWTIVVYSERFYYAEGRLLPASLRDRAQEYVPLPFYNYPAELPPWRVATPEEAARIRELVALRPTVKRSPHFFDALWRARNSDEAWENVKQIRFLGNPVTVHYSILSQISLVERQILRAARRNAAVRRWVESVGTVQGWVWRDIAQTQNRSFHAYGAAIDVLPGSMGGLETYWLWASRHTAEWWNIPYNRRYHPPEEVVRIFESFGFVWGGKWRFFDTMHFEYRPEVMILSGIPMVDFLDID